MIAPHDGGAREDVSAARVAGTGLLVFRREEDGRELTVRAAAVVAVLPGTSKGGVPTFGVCGLLVGGVVLPVKGSVLDVTQRLALAVELERAAARLERGGAA